MMTPHTADTDLLRRAYGTFPSGVIAVCGLRDGGPVGIAASSFVPVSMAPPLVSVCVQHTSTTWPRLAECPRLGLSVLGSSQRGVCRQIAAKTGDRFADVAFAATGEGAVLLHGAAAWLDCSIHDTVTAGDHDLILLRVEALRIHEDVRPLVFHRSGFHALAEPAA